MGKRIICIIVLLFLGITSFSCGVDARVELIFLFQSSPDIDFFMREFRNSILSMPIALDRNTYRIAAVAWEKDGIPYASTYFYFLGEYISLYVTEEKDFKNRATIKNVAREIAFYSLFEAQLYFAFYKEGMTKPSFPSKSRRLKWEKQY